ncbi:hypothetical protein MAH4_05270 [Sessilibacter sp. MAH4]
MAKNNLMQVLVKMAGRLKSLKIIAFGLLLSGPVCVNALELTNFRGATLVADQTSDGDYSVPLGPMRNINGNWQPESERLVQGVMSRSLLELPRNHSLTEVMQQYFSQLQRQDATPLYVCQGHTCGSSASWANEFFNDRRLYGLDQYQELLVFQQLDSEGATLATVYGVTRGNQRSYVLVDVVSVDFNSAINQEPDAKTVEVILKGQRYLSLPVQLQGGKWQMSDALTASITQTLKTSPSLKLALVVVDHRDEKLATNLAKSSDIAEQIKTQIISQQIDTARIEVHGLGSLVPAGESTVSAWLIGTR